MNPKRVFLALVGLALIYLSLNLTQAIVVTIGLWIFAYLITTSKIKKDEKALEGKI